MRQGFGLKGGGIPLPVAPAARGPPSRACVRACLTRTSRRGRRTDPPGHPNRLNPQGRIMSTFDEPRAYRPGPHRRRARHVHQPRGRRHRDGSQTRLRRPGRARRQDLRPALDVRRVHRLRHRPGDDRPDRGGLPPPQRDGVPQRRAVHAQRPDRRAVPRAAGQVRAEGIRPARGRRHADEPGRTSTGSSRRTASSESSTSAPAPRRTTRPRQSGSPTPSTSTRSASGLARRARP